MPTYPYKDKNPRIAHNVFMAEGSRIIGDVTISEESSIWFNATIRGDIAKVSIGRKTNIQDNCVLHVDYGYPLTIGDSVTVGHGVILHGCTINDGTLIGMGATILNGAVIGEESIIGANALVTEGKEIPPRSLVVGIPAKVIRELTEEEISALYKSAEGYAKEAKEYLEG